MSIFSFYVQIGSVCALLSASFFTLTILTPVRQSAKTAPANTTFSRNATPESAGDYSLYISNFALNETKKTGWGLTNIRLDTTFLLLLLFRTSAWLWQHPLENLLNALTFSVISCAQSSQLKPSVAAVELQLTNPVDRRALNDVSEGVEVDGQKGNETVSSQIEPLNSLRREDNLNATETLSLHKTVANDQQQRPHTAVSDVDSGQQSARAFGLIRTGGSIGYMLAAGAIALCTQSHATSRETCFSKCSSACAACALRSPSPCFRSSARSVWPRASSCSRVSVRVQRTIGSTLYRKRWIWTKVHPITVAFCTFAMACTEYSAYLICTK